MKTLRDLLMDRHRDMEPNLDAVRSAVLSDKSRKGNPGRPLRENRTSLIQWVSSLRWHLAGISAAWIVIAMANHHAEAIPQFVSEQAPAVARRLETLRENRRQLADLLDGGIGFPDSVQPLLGPQRRSERSRSNWMA